MNEKEFVINQTFVYIFCVSVKLCIKNNSVKLFKFLLKTQCAAVNTYRSLINSDAQRILLSLPNNSPIQGQTLLSVSLPLTFCLIKWGTPHAEKKKSGKY